MPTGPPWASRRRGGAAVVPAGPRRHFCALDLRRPESGGRRRRRRRSGVGPLRRQAATGPPQLRPDAGARHSGRLGRLQLHVGRQRQPAGDGASHAASSRANRGRARGERQRQPARGQPFLQRPAPLQRLGRRRAGGVRVARGQPKPERRVASAQRVAAGRRRRGHVHRLQRREHQVRLRLRVLRQRHLRRAVGERPVELRGRRGGGNFGSPRHGCRHLGGRLPPQNKQGAPGGDGLRGHWRGDGAPRADALRRHSAGPRGRGRPRPLRCHLAAPSCGRRWSGIAEKRRRDDVSFDGSRPARCMLTIPRSPIRTSAHFGGAAPPPIPRPYFV